MKCPVCTEGGFTCTQVDCRRWFVNGLHQNTSSECRQKPISQSAPASRRMKAKSADCAFPTGKETESTQSGAAAEDTLPSKLTDEDWVLIVALWDERDRLRAEHRRLRAIRKEVLADLRIVKAQLHNLTNVEIAKKFDVTPTQLLNHPRPDVHG